MSLPARDSSECAACKKCVYSKLDRDGWCYMFREEPIGHCMKFALCVKGEPY